MNNKKIFDNFATEVNWIPLNTHIENSYENAIYGKNVEFWSSTQPWIELIVKHFEFKRVEFKVKLKIKLNIVPWFIK